MSTKATFKFFIPCEVFDVEVILGPSEGLTVFERLVLEAIAHGQNHLDKLTEFFQIGHRPTFVLIADLWRAGHLAVDVANGGIHLTTRTKELMQQHKLDELSSSDHKHKAFKLCQELVTETGHILPFVPAQKILLPAKSETNNPYRIAPKLKEYGSYRHALLADIIEAASQAARKMPQFDHRTIKSASLKADISPNEILATQRRLWEIEAWIQQNPNGSIKFSIVSPSNLDGRIRRSLEEALNKLSLEKPDEPFVKHLYNNAQAEDDDREAGSPESLLNKLVQKVDAVAKIEGNALSAHAELSGLANSARDAVMQRWSEQAEVRLIFGAEDLRKTIIYEIRRAKHRVIMACPWLDREELDKYHDTIKEALERGVQFFLLWGLYPDGKIPDKVMHRLELWQDDGEFHWVTKAARTNECYFLRDWEVEILTGIPFLNKKASADLALSLEMRKPTALSPDDCRFVNDQFNRAYRLAPDPIFIKKLAQLRRNTICEKTPTRSEFPNPPPAPVAFKPEQWGDKEPAFTQANLTIWKNNWKYWADDLSQCFNRIGDTVFLIHDGQHRDVLLQAVEEAKSFIIIASERLSSQVFSESFKESLSNAAKRGVSIRLIYGDLHKDDELAHNRLEELFQVYPSAVHKFPASCHGGLLITEDALLLTSFSLLSKIGHDINQGRRGIQYETGAFVRSRNLIQQAVELLEQKIPGFHSTSITLQSLAPTKKAAEKEESIADQAAKTITMYLADFFGQLGNLNTSDKSANAQLAEFCHDWFMNLVENKKLVENNTVFAILEQLVPSLPSDLRELTVANCLKSYRRVKYGLGAEYEGWLLWLAGEKWHAGDYMETAILLHRCQPHSRPELPPIWLAELAADQGQPKLLEDKLIDAAYGYDLQEADLVAIFCVSCIWLGRDESEIAREVLEKISQNKLPAALKVWAEAFVACWNDAQKPSRAAHLRKNLKSYLPQFKDTVAKWQQKRFYPAPIARQLLSDLLTPLLEEQSK